MKPIGDIQGRRHNVKYAYLDATGSGNTEIVAAVTGYKIRLLSAVVVALTAVTVHFESATTQISADNAVGATGGWTMPESENGWCETVAGQALNVNLSAAVATGVTITYELVNI
jgi:hypothetical protein